MGIPNPGLEAGGARLGCKYSTAKTTREIRHWTHRLLASDDLAPFHRCPVAWREARLLARRAAVMTDRAKVKDNVWARHSAPLPACIGNAFPYN
jgi:hypothetical protein